MVMIIQKSYVALFPLWSFKKVVGNSDVKSREHVKTFKIDVNTRSNTDILKILLLTIIEVIMMIVPLLVLLLLLLLPLVKVIIIIIIITMIMII